MQPKAARPDRTLIVILAITAAIVIIAVVLVIVRSKPTQFDPASPEGAVQAYTNAVLTGDYPAALDLLPSKVRKDCERSDPNPAEGFSMSIDSTSVEVDRAVVRVSMEQLTGGLYGGSTYTTEDKFVLIKEGDSWKIERSPWELMMCIEMWPNK